MKNEKDCIPCHFVFHFVPDSSHDSPATGWRPISKDLKHPMETHLMIEDGLQQKKRKKRNRLYDKLKSYFKRLSNEMDIQLHHF